jgi:hypothetical protein
LATFKKDWSRVGRELKELDPNFPLERW